MDTQARQKYLSSQIMTAPPEKLRLMLIDAAIRNTTIVIEHWDDDDRGTLWESGSKAQEIVTELIAGVNREANTELAEKIIAIYVFIFRRLVEGISKRDLDKVKDALRILESERETWRQICLQLPAKREQEEKGTSTTVAASTPYLSAGGLPGSMSGGIPGSIETLGSMGDQVPPAGFSAEG